MKRAVDFDGTLATYEKWKGPEILGEPIGPMVDRVNAWLDAGDEVIIFTARAYHDDDGKFTKENADISVAAIGEWCKQHFGQELEVTCVKDPEIEEIWDDRAIHVEKNTGEVTQAEVEAVTADILETMEW